MVRKSSLGFMFLLFHSCLILLFFSLPSSVYLLSMLWSVESKTQSLWGSWLLLCSMRKIIIIGYIVCQMLIWYFYPFIKDWDRQLYLPFDVIIISHLIVHLLKAANTLNTSASYFSLQPQPIEVDWAEIEKDWPKVIKMAKGKLECSVSVVRDPTLMSASEKY